VTNERVRVRLSSDDFKRTCVALCLAFQGDSAVIFEHVSKEVKNQSSRTDDEQPDENQHEPHAEHILAEKQKSLFQVSSIVNRRILNDRLLFSFSFFL
jgi:hypothetical protein